MTDRAQAGRLLAISVLGLAIAIWLGVGYATRHSSHAGFYRVRVADPGPTAHLVRPRRTVVVVVDGLGHVEAEAMPVLDRLAAIGQCRTTHVGPLSVSRPVYAVLSTGLDQDRTGARGNDDTTALGAQSLWELARRAGLRVTGISEVPWWRELFPAGFDAYVIAPAEEDYVAGAPPGDLMLVHPVYVDDVGHAHGAASDAYRAAVDRVAREIGEQIGLLDLSRDLLVVTADHGQMPRGGHGGRQDRVSRVRTCFAGAGVRRGPGGAMRTTTIAPTLAVLLGLPFPSDMRAGEDDLDTVFEIVDDTAFPAGYVDERRATVARFRDANARQLRAWMPDSDGRWSRFRWSHRVGQALAAIPCALAWLAVVVGQLLAHRRRARARWPGLVLSVAVPLAMVVTQLLVRGSFDLSSVSTSEDFLAFTIGMGIVVCGAAIALDLRLRADLGATVTDWTALSLATTVLTVAHPVIFGWTVGYPAPPAELFFYPYFATLAFGAIHLTGLLVFPLAWRATAPR